MSIPPILGWFFGQWLDKKFDTSPYFMLFLIFAGVIAGFREVYRIIRRYGDEV
ncbi:MAG: AtpZ/AtpI family protein [Parachlamydiaceae bacterium]|nr:AtpZ/AtpI family protein [Parachlamydiaceae bacterium]